jgi:hypothetical protein
MKKEDKFSFSFSLLLVPPLASLRRLFHDS